MRRNTTPAATRRRSRTQANITATVVTASLAADLQMLRTLQSAQTQDAPFAITV